MVAHIKYLVPPLWGGTFILDNNVGGRCMDIVLLGLLKKYVEDSLIGMGALKGEKGDPGRDGLDGKDGKDGQDGRDGKDGKDATITIGLVQTGTKSSVTNSGSPNDAVFDFVLEKGDKGDQGPIGPIGPQGIRGAIGPQGPQGAKGNTGEKGDKGDKGDPGEKGATGAQGI